MNQDRLHYHVDVSETEEAVNTTTLILVYSFASDDSIYSRLRCHVIVSEAKEASYATSSLVDIFIR